MTAAIAKVEQETRAAVQGWTWGVDLSHHQGTVNFEQLEVAGCSFVLTKATEGQTHVDPKWVTNAVGVRAFGGMHFGAYHFARIDTDLDDPLDAKLEAESFARAVEHHGTWLEEPLALPPVLDLEWFGSLSAKDERDAVARNVAWALAWVEHCERLLGRSPMIYTGPNVWQERFGAAGDLAHLPLWMVDIEQPGEVKPIDVGVEAWHADLHQWTHEGRVPGVRARVDVNVSIDDAEGLARLAKLRMVRPEPEITSPVVRLMRNLLGVPIAPFEDLDRGTVATLQGLLLARGMGPQGLVDRAGRPDGILGPATIAALDRFMIGRGLAAEGSKSNGLSPRDWVELLRA